jgi:hypothetical protein
MKLTKEQITILVFATAFFVVTFLYVQSLQTIKSMYNESILANLETVSEPINVASSTPVIPPQSVDPVVNEPIVASGSDPFVPPVSKPEPEPKPDNGCYVGGCSGQLCGDVSIKDVATTCEWRSTYACYQDSITVCERQPDGQCGWTPTKELESCLLNPDPITEEINVAI